MQLKPLTNHFSTTKILARRAGFKPAPTSLALFAVKFSYFVLFVSFVVKFVLSFWFQLRLAAGQCMVHDILRLADNRF
jgi:hypothetical protein